MDRNRTKKLPYFHFYFLFLIHFGSNTFRCVQNQKKDERMVSLYFLSINIKDFREGQLLISDRIYYGDGIIQIFHYGITVIFEKSTEIR